MIADHVVEYYQKLHQKGNVIENQILPNSVDPLVSENQYLTLTTLRTEREIYNTLCGMSLLVHMIQMDLEVLSLNLVGKLLNQTWWPLFTIFFLHGHRPEHFNSVHVISIPKVKDANRGAIQIYCTCQFLV